MSQPRFYLLGVCWFCGLALLLARPGWSQGLPERADQGAASTAAGEAAPAYTVQLVERAQTDYLAAKEGKGKAAAEAKLERYVDKYAQHGIERDKQVLKRLRALFGEDFSLYWEVSRVQTPIDGDGEAIRLRGCKPHDCDSNAAVVVIWRDGVYQALLTRDDIHATYYGPPIDGPAAVEKEKRFLAWFEKDDMFGLGRVSVEQIEAVLRRRW